MPETLFTVRTTLTKERRTSGYSEPDQSNSNSSEALYALDVGLKPPKFTCIDPKKPFMPYNCRAELDRTSGIAAKRAAVLFPLTQSSDTVANQPPKHVPFPHILAIPLIFELKVLVQIQDVSKPYFQNAFLPPQVILLK